MIKYLNPYFTSKLDKIKFCERREKSEFEFSLIDRIEVKLD